MNFRSQRKRDPAFQSIISHKTMTMNDEVCLEQRAFYRLISGLHASINIHLSANYLLSEKKSMGFVSPDGIWGPNLDEFERRFSPVFTDNEGPHWLRNLYFAYLLELRALVKVAPLLRREAFFTGLTDEDKEVQTAMNDLLKVVE
jgi:ERO1-like protein alpha